MVSLHDSEGRGFSRLMLGIGLAGLVATVVVVVLGLRVVSRTGATLASSLELTAEAVATVDDTLVVAAEAVETVANGLDSVTDVVAESESALRGAGQVLTDTGLALRQDVPASIDAIRDTMPALIQSAEFLESALGALSILGVDFDPPVPPADSLRTVESGLAGISERLRGTSEDLGDLGVGLDGLSDGAGSLSQELETLETRLEEADRLLGSYGATTQRTALLVEEASVDLETQRRDGQLIVLLLGFIVGLGQAVPLTLAWQSSRRRPWFEPTQAGVERAAKEETHA